MTGWIKFNRSTIESPIWGSPFTLRLLLLLSCRALQKEFMYVEEVKVHRGQYLRSYSRLAEDLQYVENGNLRIPSKNTIKLSVDRLRKYGLISTEETKIGTLFTLLENDGDFSALENGRTEDEAQLDEADIKAALKEECKKGREEKEKEKEKESVRARDDLSSKPEVQRRVEMVTGKFLKLRNSGFYISPKEQCAIEKIAEKDIEVETLLFWMEELQSAYRKRNANDTIKSFTYYEKALMRKIRKSRSASKPPSSSANQLKETNDFLAKLERWKREGEARIANGSKRIKPAFVPVWAR
ncbi:DNA helicase [Rossellomorea vietnamensis]|uniref:DNA helicase n=1 Tax=Rossellomorea vietnamensis TaxID=218284 RepID=A0A5D4MHP7_9BACI|nr:DNA helicase [Rossellomorea vietnamensis]TYS01273.1 DNA helicase [Rossellomorea vietnamensis]